jgi:hypothetical protein
VQGTPKYKSEALTQKLTFSAPALLFSNIKDSFGSSKEGFCERGNETSGSMKADNFSIILFTFISDLRFSQLRR